MKAAADLRADQRCVVLLPDSIRNYLTKFVSDQWMEVRNLKPIKNIHNHWWWDTPVSALPVTPVATILPSTTCSKTLSKLKELKVEELPIVNEEGLFKGMATLENLMNHLIAKTAKQNDPISHVTEEKFGRIDVGGSLGMLSRVFEKDPYAIVLDRKFE